MIKNLLRFFARRQTPSVVVPIYTADDCPPLEGYEELNGYAIDAYPFTAVFEESARATAINTVSEQYNIPTDQVLKQFEVCIVPSPLEYHGRIMARKKVR